MVERVFEVQINGRVFGDIEEGLQSVATELENSLNRAAPRVSRAMLESLHRVAGIMEQRHGNPWSEPLAVPVRHYSGALAAV